MISSKPAPRSSNIKVVGAVPDKSAVMDLGGLHGKLHGRSTQQKTLLKAYRRLSAVEDKTESKEIILSSGPSGTGKTALALSLREAALEDGGYFISGKFDQLQRPEPYAPFVAAFIELANSVVLKGESSLSLMKDAIDSEMDGEGRILTDMIPAWEQIIGEQEEIESLQGSEALHRFQSVFQRFLRAICSLGSPLVLFLDDLQWADPGSLSLLSVLIEDVDNQGFVCVGTCRDDAPPDSPLCITLRQLEDENVYIKNIGVTNLDEHAVTEMLSDLLQLEYEKCKSLANVVYAQSNGNVFFIVSFVRSLRNEGFLYFDQSSMRWNWSEEKALQSMPVSEAETLLSY